MISHLIKSPPATRKCDLLGRNRHIRELVFVSENKILVKLVNAQWVMLDPNGKVLPLPAELKIINEISYDRRGNVVGGVWFAVSSG